MKAWLKLQLRLWRNVCKDLWSGAHFNFAQKLKTNISFSHSITIKQEIKPSEFFENKIYNLKQAAQLINAFWIPQHSIFSFWKIIGNPNKNFKAGRTILNGQIKHEIGGGICQISGIIHYLSLLAGLKIIERHAHSMDIYTEASRFAPLGTDATVVYGSKDLRIQNNFSTPIRFQLFVADNYLFARLESQSPIPIQKLNSKIDLDENQVQVILSDEGGIVVSYSTYKRNKENDYTQPIIFLENTGCI